MKKFLFGVREFAWIVADEVANWLYPYRNQLTPEEKFEVRVKDPMSGEMWMIEELIQQMNQKVDKLQDDMMYVCLLYTSPSPRDGTKSRMPSSA